MIPQDMLDDLRYQRSIRHLHKLGPRWSGELLQEMAERSGQRTWLDQRLEFLRRFDPSAVEALGLGDWPHPVHEVR
jgi:hypothetical protein